MGYDLFGLGNNFEITILLRVGKIPLVVDCPIVRLDFNGQHKVLNAYVLVFGDITLCSVSQHAYSEVCSGPLMISLGIRCTLSLVLLGRSTYETKYYNRSSSFEELQYLRESNFLP